MQLSSEIQLSLAEMFRGEGENYRAITEYKKFLFFFPDSPERDLALLNMAKTYMQGEDYQSAVSVFQHLRATDLGSRFAGESHYLEGICYWKSGDVDNADRQLSRASDMYKDDLSLFTRTSKARAIIAFEDGKVDRSYELLNDLLRTGDGEDKVSKAIILIEEHQKKNFKSPGLAASLSTVLPGAGYFYAGRPGDGVSAFVINALFIAGLVEAIDRENDGMAILAGGFGLPFYVGNIYGSANAARKWNLSLRRKAVEEISLTLGFDF